MIKPSELRIGNFINCGFMYSIKVDYNTFREIEDSTEEFWKVSGIPLTEEWLLKFGFEKVEDGYQGHYELDGHWIYLIRDGFEFEFAPKTTKPKRFNLFTVFKYVHQLQNLYFTLTGEELKISELAAN